MVRYTRFVSSALDRVRRCCKTIRHLYKDNPGIFAGVLGALLILLLVGAIFSTGVARLLGSRGAVVVDLIVVWLFARLVARALMFPGSLRIFQRNTEATFRAEMARQYVHYLRQLWNLLRLVARQADGPLRGVTADGVLRGCSVVETLVSSFRMQQQQHEVHLSKEQELIHAAAQDLQNWLTSCTIHWAGQGSGPFAAGIADPSRPTPFLEWVRVLVFNGLPNMQALAGYELLAPGGREAASRGLERLEQLLQLLEELRSPKQGMLKSALRFFQVPAIGSLNQLRTELQTRHSGQHCWVPTKGGHRIDAMFLPYDGSNEMAEHEAAQEDAPLRGAPRPMRFSGPTLVWCNPNAAYYETMVYQPAWLNYWLSRGVNLFLFNYAGYGRSTGRPSPGRIAEDGEAVVEYLKSRGVTQIGIYGRSIGGVVACHLARRFPEMVRLLIADRTMSTLEGAAQCIYGSWAAKGLRLTAMMADNVDNFLEVRCYKLLICDPKDAMIMDLAALRTGVALRVVERMLPEESMPLEEAKLKRVAQVWKFFSTLFAICESEDDTFQGSEPLRPARQPAFAADIRSKSGDASELQQVLRSGRSPSASELVGAAWLEENANLVRARMAPLVDQVRTALDVVGEYLEGGGVTLSDVFADSPADPAGAIRCMLANLQVWGTLGDLREDYQPGPAADAELGALPPECRPYGPSVSERDLERFLQRTCDRDFPLMREMHSPRLEQLQRHLTPEMISMYHRRLARTRVSLARHEFRRRLSAVRSSIANASGDMQAGEHAELLLATVLRHLEEIDGFVSGLSRFFKKVDLAFPDGRPVADNTGDAAPAGDSSDERPLGAACSATPRPPIDHSLAGFLMHTDCGHNGALDEADLRQLALHLRAAGFGRAPI